MFMYIVKIFKSAETNNLPIAWCMQLDSERQRRTVMLQEGSRTLVLNSLIPIVTQWREVVLIA